MSFRTAFLSPRRLTAMFIATIVLPAAALAFLAWRTLEQDRELERQRVQDRLDRVAADIAFGLDSRLKEISRQLPLPDAAARVAAPPDTLLVIASQNRSGSGLENFFDALNQIPWRADSEGEL